MQRRRTAGARVCSFPPEIIDLVVHAGIVMPRLSGGGLVKGKRLAGGRIMGGENRAVRRDAGRGVMPQDVSDAMSTPLWGMAPARLYGAYRALGVFVTATPVARLGQVSGEGVPLAAAENELGEEGEVRP